MGLLNKHVILLLGIRDDCDVKIGFSQSAIQRKLKMNVSLSQPRQRIVNDRNVVWTGVRMGFRYIRSGFCINERVSVCLCGSHCKCAKRQWTSGSRIIQSSQPQCERSKRKKNYTQNKGINFWARYDYVCIIANIQQPRYFFLNILIFFAARTSALSFRLIANFETHSRFKILWCSFVFQPNRWSFVFCSLSHNRYWSRDIKL